MQRSALLFYAATVACAGMNPSAIRSSTTLGARLMLAEPINQKCAQSGVKNCDDITEGLLLYVESKKEEGTQHLRVAAASNSPDALRSFARASNPGGDLGNPRWAISVGPNGPTLVGLKLPVRPGEALFLALQSPASTQTNPQCAVTWSGYRVSATQSEYYEAPVVEGAPPPKPRSEDAVTVAGGSKKDEALPTKGTEALVGERAPARGQQPSRFEKLDDADTLVREAFYDAAIPIYQSIAEQDEPETLPRALHGLGVAYYSRGDCAKAVAAFRRYLPYALNEEFAQVKGLIRECEAKLH